MYGCTVLKKPECISDQKYFMDVFVLILLDSIEAYIWKLKLRHVEIVFFLYFYFEG